MDLVGRELFFLVDRQLGQGKLGAAEATVGESLPEVKVPLEGNSQARWRETKNNDDV